MALFLIKRDVRGATATDYDAAIFRAISCVYDFEGLNWVHSYWDREAGFSYCIYEAESAEQLHQHAERAQIPCDEVYPVAHMVPEAYEAGRLNEVESSAP
jgi:hypothetical protein